MCVAGSPRVRPPFCCALYFQVCWAHPRFGQVLGSCGYDRRVVVWQQQGKGPGFAPVYSNEDHGASVNSLAFAPESAGLVLAAGSSDGCISVLTHMEGTGQEWARQAFSAHFNGVLTVAWAPVGGMGAPGEHRHSGLLLASGGGDNRVRLWAVDSSQVRLSLNFCFLTAVCVTGVCSFLSMSVQVDGHN